jgi:RHS repeat-associated protein/uncharacterized repeat protein (TIGR01451 family)
MPIPGSDFIWFNAIVKAGSLGPSAVRVFLRAATIQFSTAESSYTIPIPDALITFSPNTNSASTLYDPNKNEWITTVPSTGISGNTFLSGVTFPVPSTGLPGGITSLTWTGTFYSDTAGISINWQWAAAVYSSFGNDYRTLGVKPVDDPDASEYKNSDPAATPENYKAVVVPGATGSGGSNYTGSYGTTGWVAPFNEVPNYPPVANAGADQTAHVTDTVQLDGTHSTDRDGDPLTYRWLLESPPAGSVAVLNNPNMPLPTFTVDKPGTYIVQLIVNDGKIDSSPSEVTITTINSPPVANAGMDQTVFQTATVQLDGSKSTDVDGDPLTYAWVLTSFPPGSTATISAPTAVNPTFVADLKGIYIAQLVVNDGHVNSAPASITISSENSPPVANAGPDQTIQAGRTVTLDGSKSVDVDGDPLTFRWSVSDRPAGSTATLSDPTAVRPTFFGDEVGTYVFQLIVNDGFVDSAPVTVSVTTENTPPVANAGPNQSVLVNNTVILDGSKSSDVDGNPITYRWALLSSPSNSTAHLIDPTAVNSSFIADVKGTYVAELIVNDGFVDSAPATVMISSNSPPVANAGGAQTVLAGTSVTLNGSGSTDVDGDPLTFRWAITSKPANSTATLSDPTAVTPTFLADQLGTYVVQLIVNDGIADSVASTVTITTDDSAPVANAGLAQSVPLGAVVTLDGSGSSDADAQPLTYQWALLSSPAGSLAAVSNPTSVNPTFTADLAGDYVLQLIVSDGFLSSAPNTVKISTINSIPVANAGVSQQVAIGTTVQLDGSGSSDADRDPLTYRWDITVRPTGSAAVVSDPAAVRPTFVADLAGTYVAQLIVNDGKVGSTPATVMIVAGTPVLELAAPPAVAGLPGQTIALNFVATNTGVFDALQAVFSSGTTTVPLGIIPVGQSQSAIVSFAVPAIPAKGQAESDASYLSRLQSSDNQALPVTGSVTWNDQAAHAYGPVSATASVTEQIPVITPALSAPATVKAGDPITYTLTLTNAGHASGTVSTLSITLPDGSVQSPALSPSTLAPGASASATLQFTVPPSKTGTVSALAEVSWQDSNGNSYGPLSATAVTDVNGFSPAILASCAPSGSLSLLIQNGNVTAYVPNGAWQGHNITGIHVVPVEGPGTITSVATAGVVNSCSSNSVTGQTVCTANDRQVYLLRDSIITDTLTSQATGNVGFSGGGCQNCGVAINAVTNQAILTVGLSGNSAGGIEALDLATNNISAPVPTSGVSISEDISIDPVRGLVLSASESSAFEIFKADTGSFSVFDQVIGDIPHQYELDSTAEDCTTGIAVAPAEHVFNSLGQPTADAGVFVADLTQASFTPGPPALWTTGQGQQFQSIPEFQALDGIAVAQGSQLGIGGGDEGGENAIAAFRLPATSGAGTPALQDWVRATIPSPGQPNGSTVIFGGVDPHKVTAYISPNDGKAYGVVADSTPFFLAVIDLAALLNLPRSPANPHTVDGSIDLLANGVVRFVPIGSFVDFPLVPNSGQQGTQNLVVEIQGAGTHFVQGLTNVSMGAGIIVTGVTVNSPTDLVAQLDIDPLASIGGRSVNISTGSEVLTTTTQAFSVARGPAKLTLVSPGSIAQGQSVTVTITGSATHFAQDVTTVDFGFSGNSIPSTLTGLTVNSPTSLTITANISPLEPAVQHNVVVTTGGEIVTSTMNVTPGPATLIFATPKSSPQGRQNLILKITGQATHFLQGTTVLTSDAFQSNAPAIVISPTSLLATVSLQANATVGPHSITAITAGEHATLVNGFNVTSGVPTLVRAGTPALLQGATNASIALTGAFTNFVQGTSVADFGPGITVNSLTVTSPIAASANVSIDPLAIIGLRNVSVTTGSEVATLINGFTVNAGSALISTFTPASLAQGQQNATVTITGFLTHFAQGISTAAFGPGINVNSVTVTSPTSATAVVSVDPSASGARPIAVLTNGEIAPSKSSLSIATGTPELIAIAPRSAAPGTQNVSVAITGFGTHFAQGTSVASFGAGVTVASLTVNSATSATAVISIDPAATPGARDVTVTTGTEVARFTSGFLVAPPPTAASFGLSEGHEITKPTDIVGSVGAGSWVLSYALASQDGTGPAPVFVPFASGTAAVTNGVLGTFDPSLLLNGNYIIQLSSTDQFGQISTVSANVEVERNVKVGNFTLSFNDLNVPMPGLPITVTRTYDSRDKQSHDFGVGWTLSLVNVRLQKNGQLGSRWQMTQNGTGVSVSFCLEESKPHFVTITFPDGRLFKFQETVTPQCQQISPIETADISFVELPGASNTQGATLSIAGNSNVLVTPPSAGPVDLLDSVTTQEFNPTVFQLTTAEGYVYVIDQTLGATSVTDSNGNQLTINAAGITSSDGKSVVFTRDTQGRITQITDPLGNVLNYSYSGTGDLTTFVDRAGNVTTFGYDGTHLLTNVADPRAVQAVKNVYDSAGRLTDTIDADGNAVHYDHQLSANTEVITDRLGHSTTYEYDDDGNILHKIQTVAGAQIDTAYTYDPNDNKLSELLPGHLNPSTFTYDGLGDQLTQTDPLGHQTTYGYNGNRQVTSIDDANPAGPTHGTTTNAYDPATHNLLSTTDAENHVTTYTYFPNGQVKSVTVDNVQTASFVYDGTGNLQMQTDANGVPTTYTYDANGNRKTQKVTRTLPDGSAQDLITSYNYDANDRLVQTTYPDNSTTQIKYNAIGKQSDVIDQLGHITHYDYDNQGRLKQTTYAMGTVDSTSELIGYDAEGRRKTFQDRSGRTTTYDYDEIGRLTKTHYPDTKFTETVYDGSGRVTDIFDALRHQTHYDYDDADRRTGVTDAAGKQTTFAYDNVGNQTSVTDALQHTTTFSYDRLGRRVLTTYHDLSTEAEHYDFLGRADSKTDQAGRITQYGYDNVGRLKTVTQTLNPGTANEQELVTSYGYDEVGERISQTDANNHTTLYGYDQLGRRSSRTLPAGGASESYVYDVAGNLHLKTDFNGHSTTYAYDNMNRLKLKTADAFFSTGACAGGACGATSVSFTYTATGQRQTMLDATGTTTYGYDLRDRLKSKATPFGTVSYTYDDAGNMETMASSNVGGASITYGYDPVNRLASVTDALGAGGALETTTYSYDPVGNLAGYSYPNGVSTSYTYDPLNRLTNMQSACGTAAPGCGPANTVISSYTYTLGPTGNRLSAAELSGRTVNYGYDDLYRLTSETVAADPRGNNGQVTYTLDNVGNRLQRNSRLPAIVPTGLLSYDANDRVSTDSYDANGNTVFNSGQTNVYDFENRLVQRGGVTVIYDGDGNRVKETVAGVPTSYLIADQNPTGYAQVLDELQNGAVTRTYSYGLELINERQNLAGTLTTSFYGYDGHGSVRFLTDSTGAITDTYDYDAFGNLISSTGSTPNNYLFAGEQFDPALGIYYNRARYYDQRQGRFWTMDTLEGNERDPLSLHKYLFASLDPVDDVDPSGHDSLAGLNVAAAMVAALMTVTFIAAYETKTHVIGNLLNATSGAAGELYDEFSYAAQRTVATAELAASAASRDLSEYISEAKAKIQQKARSLKKPLKVVPVPSQLIPTIAAHDAMAQGAGYPDILTRCTTARATANRAAATAGLPPVSGYGLSWDEYPFASSYQGGSGASVMGVPGKEQSIQGGIIAGSYALEQIAVGDDYFVVVF